MWNHRLLVLLCAVVGVVACFYPMVPGEGKSCVAYALTVPAARTEAMLVVGGLTLALVAGVIGIMRPPFGRGLAMMALAGFAVAVVPNADHLGEMFDAPLGGKLLAGAILGGAALSVLTLVVPERAAA